VVIFHTDNAWFHLHCSLMVFKKKVFWDWCTGRSPTDAQSATVKILNENITVIRLSLCHFSLQWPRPGHIFTWC